MLRTWLYGNAYGVSDLSISGSSICLYGNMLNLNVDFYCVYGYHSHALITVKSVNESINNHL